MIKLEDRKYTKLEVYELLRKEQFESQGNLSDKQDKINELLEENKHLVEELNIYKQQADMVGKALVSAVGKAKDIEDSAKRKVNAKLNRLKLFDAKFVNIYKKILSKYPLDNDLIEVEQFLKRMDEVLEVENMTTKESPRRMFNVSSGGSKLYEELLPNDSGFDLNEALNPVGDLEAICKELGLMKE